MGLKDAVNQVLKSVIKKEYDSLQEVEVQDKNLPNVRQTMTYDQEMYFMEILQRGDMKEICTAAQTILKDNNSFWSIAASEDGIPLKHAGLDETIVKTISNIVTELYENVEFSSDFQEEADIWDNINEDQNFATMLMQAITDVLYFGDCAFLIAYEDGKVLLKYEVGRNLEYIYDRNKQLKEIIVKKRYIQGDKKYLLKEFYGADALYVKYRLYKEDGDEVPLGTIEELKDLKDIEILRDDKYVDCAFATQFMINKSIKYKGRGTSIFSTKLDALDALDEVVSQRQSVIRSGAPKEFVDESCISKSANGVKNINKTAMHKFYEKSNTTLNGANKDIEVLQSELRAEEYRIEEEDAKRRVLEGILSEQTVSNTSVINNTSITKEREKQTNYTISNIKKAVQELLPKYIYNIINIYYIYNGMETEITPTDITIIFDEYNNPTFENQVDTCKKIKESRLLPNFEMLKELYGNTKTDDEIAEIAARLDVMDGYTFTDSITVEEESAKADNKVEEHKEDDEEESTADDKEKVIEAAEN